jgi:hypothetical protein
MPTVLQPPFSMVARLALLSPFLCCLYAQEPAKPKIKVNMINVCSPSPEEQQEISSALGIIPKRPVFGPDFEVDRGRSTAIPTETPVGSPTDDGPKDSRWVRVRREFTSAVPYSAVQYSFSVDRKDMVETLVFHVRDPKTVLEVAIENRASAVTTPASMLGTNTAAERIKLERFGKSSIILARCGPTEAGPAPDQTAYEPLFKSAAAVIAGYRSSLRAKQLVPDELARIGLSASAPKSSHLATPGTRRQEQPAKKSADPKENSSH